MSIEIISQSYTIKKEQKQTKFKEIWYSHKLILWKIFRYISPTLPISNQFQILVTLLLLHISNMNSNNIQIQIAKYKKTFDCSQTRSVAFFISIGGIL